MLFYINYRLFLLVGSIYLTISSLVWGQSIKMPDVLVSGSYVAIPLPDFFRDIEQKYPVRFFYQDAWIEDVVISGDFQQENLLHILEQAGVQFTILSPYVVIMPPATDQNEKRDEINHTAASLPTGIFDENITYTVSGYVRELNSGEPVIGATVRLEELNTGTITNTAGFYSITIPSGRYNFTYAYVGFEEQSRLVELRNNLIQDVDLSTETTRLQEIIISDHEHQNIADVQMGVNRLNVATIKKMPALMGEVDVVRSLLLLPGVSSVGEGATGFNVRGGSVDQNLILLDDIPLFNTSHLFGFFSAFNSEAVHDLTLYKGGIPVNYGGRISSILDVKLKQGNAKKFTGNGGIGFLSTQLMLEGPMQKDKTTFMVSGRTSYSDWYLNLVDDPNINESTANFYDVIAKVSHAPDNRNRISFTGYHSHDRFKFPGDTTYGWQNLGASLQWSHVFNEKLFLDAVLAFSDYNYEVEGTGAPNTFQWNAGVDYYNAKADFSYFLGTRHTIDFGLSGIYYHIDLGSLVPVSESSINSFALDAENGLESALYVGDEFTISPNLTLTGGLRFSMFQSFGPRVVDFFDSHQPRSLSNITKTEYFDRWENIQTYTGVEPRVSLRIGLGIQSAIKAGYNRMFQYVHLISNTTAISPVDIWKLSSNNIQPQVGDQVSVGFFRNFMANTYETSVEVYYKNIQHIIDYKDGANLTLNRYLEADLLSGKGRAYGVEFLVKKNKGRLTGWAGYTYSRTERRVDGNFPEERINQGNYYPAYYDKPHDLSIVTNYQFSRRYRFSANFTYSTGRPVSFPASQYDIEGIPVANFESRNQERIDDYHRLDLSLTFEGNHKKNKKIHGTWTFSVYNVYARKNPYSVFFKPYRGVLPQAFRLAVIGTAIPAITYNFRF